MTKHQAIVYVSDHCSSCQSLLEYLDKHRIIYTKRNVTKKSTYMRDLQRLNIFGTPVLFTCDDQQPILGFQEALIAKRLKIKVC